MRKLRSDAGVPRKYAKQVVTVRRRYRCICADKHCRARRTLTKHPSLYARQPRCFCGHPLRVDWGRTLRHEVRRENCTCSETHHPHRRGWCEKRQSERMRSAA